MTAPRICVDCKKPLTDQTRWHTRRKPVKTKWGLDKYCQGPRRTPGAPTPAQRRRRMTKPVHYRFYASSTPNSVCGLRGGRTAGKYKDAGAQVPWSRLNVKLEQTTCEECLAILHVTLKDRLMARLAVSGGTLDAALERARTRITMNGVEGLVSNG